MLVVPVVCCDMGYLCDAICVRDKNEYIPERTKIQKMKTAIQESTQETYLLAIEHKLNYINILYPVMSRWIMDVFGGALRARGRKVTVAVDQLIRVYCFRSSGCCMK